MMCSRSSMRDPLERCDGVRMLGEGAEAEVLDTLAKHHERTT